MCVQTEGQESVREGSRGGGSSWASLCSFLLLASLHAIFIYTCVCVCVCVCVCTSLGGGEGQTTTQQF